jgi:hypothetical protein
LLELELWPVGGAISRCGYRKWGRRSADWRGEFFGEVWFRDRLLIVTSLTFNSFPTILRDKWQHCVISTSFAVAHNIYGPGLERLLVMLGRRS